MQTFKTISKLIFFIAFNVLVVLALHTALAQPSVVDVLMETADNDETIDTIILGQSSGECGYNPYIIGEGLSTDSYDCEVINCARRLMPVQNMYYLLKSANSTGQIKRVILDIDTLYWYGDYTAERGTDNNVFLQNVGLTKLEYMYDEALDENFTNYLFDYQFTGATLKRIPSILKSKLNSAYINNEESSISQTNEIMGLGKNFEYVGRGFRYGINVSEDPWENYIPTTWKEEELNQKSLATLDNIKEYCDENGIELICVFSAQTPYRNQHDNLDDVHNTFEKICTVRGIRFIDMNCVSEEYFPRDDYDFVDIDGHMLGETADRQSELLAEIINSSDPDKYFR